MSAERVEALGRLAGLLADERQAITRRDPDALLSCLRGVSTVFATLAGCLDSPLGPRERAQARILARLNRGNRNLLQLLREPLCELDALAARHGVAIALDSLA